jgi:hypothetical protein
MSTSQRITLVIVFLSATNLYAQKESSKLETTPNDVGHRLNSEEMIEISSQRKGHFLGGIDHHHQDDVQLNGKRRQSRRNRISRKYRG